MNWLFDLLNRLLHDHRWGEWQRSIPKPSGDMYCYWVKRCACGATRHRWEHDYDTTKVVRETYPVHDSFPVTLSGNPCRYCGAIRSV